MTTGLALKALQTCEEELRKLAAEAAAEGDYDVLARLASTARSVSEIARDWQAGEPVTAFQGIALTTEQPESVRQSAADAQSQRRAAASRRYPRFVRRGDDLVKIGWSRSDKREYRHRAGHSVLVALSQALLESSRRRRLFTMEDLERQLGKGGEAVPGYQGYAWLAWLRFAGLVKQHGRQGYSVVKPTTFEKDLDRVFASVPAQET